MITLGGSIGTGIFLASGNALSFAGPGEALLACLIMEIIVYFLMMGLGEMVAFIPTSGSFYVYALGYALGWNYWYSCAIYIASEISASASIMNFWFPDSSSLIWCPVFLVLIIGFNAISTKVFGEVEYWLSFLKISVVIVFIVIVFFLILGFAEYDAGGFQNWRIGDAPFHSGWVGILGALVAAGFSFQGTELIGIAAGESENPQTNIPKAIKMIFWRILIFFILSLFIISLLIPYTSSQLGNSDVVTSPFTLVFKQYNNSFAAVIMNAVIFIAVISTANSSMYVGSRMLWYLAKEGHVPRIFSRVNQRGVPIYALVVTSLVTAFAFISSIFGNGTVYFCLLSATSFSGFIASLLAIIVFARHIYIREKISLSFLI
ncbi:amino acid permease [Legionella sainthelensi]|uniref:Amino acid permease n=1 Tax=Legionella sainthelensi TaxID=28087 RepID=A0A0W0YE23_9GAMM|nr:amino acid permease [Legionella sainthelensi]KTD55104.1 amino acid permease [Legionella sainthelensi]VEH36683.1 amino acid permease [Legionella sainthelensi]